MKKRRRSCNIMECFTLILILSLSNNINGATCNSLFFSQPKKLKLLRTDSDFSGVNTNMESHKPEKSLVSFCPARCQCNVTLTNQIQVLCHEHFDHDFPIATLRKDVEILRIQPKCQRYEFSTISLKDRKCISIKENSLTIGPNLKHLRLLKVLIITDSQIPNIGARTLWGLSGLKVLNLKRNSLTNLIDKNFDGLYSLKELYLDNNQIKSMISASFRHINNLEILSLSHNYISDLAPRIFYKLRNLKKLDLSYNKLNHIDGEIFQDIPKLESFSCEGCGLFRMDLPINVYLSSLRVLHLSNNTFQSINKNIDRKFLLNLIEFDISYNKIKKLIGFPSPYLIKFNAAKNNISSVGDCSFCNSSLQELNLGYNRITRINIEMLPKECHSMKYLSMSGNWVNLNSLEQFLHRLPNLENLQLAHTGIVNVPLNIFYGNKYLKSLNLSQNLLIDLEPASIESLNQLEVLDLSSNFLMGLSDDFFDEVKNKKNIQMVYLQNNQWKCDRCHIRPLLKFLNKSLMYWGSCFSSSNIQTNPLCLRCSSPDDLLNTKVQNLKDDHSLPDCDPFYQEIQFDSQFPNSVHSKERTVWNTNSPYVVLGLVAALIVILVIFLVAKYRQYGVYLTNEGNSLAPEENEDVLADPIVVLDRNAESYISLKYPVIPEE